jgi:preprotein translocase subunit SecD
MKWRRASDHRSGALRVATTQRGAPWATWGRTLGEPPLTSGAPGSACGESGTTTYQVGASLGEVTPTAVTYASGQAARQVFRIEFDDAGRVTLAAVTRGAVGKELAILVQGRVLSAAHVVDPSIGGQFELATTTPAETEKVAAALHASATS